jgi:hypothetical protein
MYTAFFRVVIMKKELSAERYKLHHPFKLITWH